MAITLLIGLNFLLFVGVQAARIVFSLYALVLGATPSGVGGILAMLFVLPLFLSWPIGVLSDRRGARSLLVFGTAAGALGMFVPYFLHTVGALYIAAAMLGLMIAFMSVMGQNLVGILSKPHQRTRNFGNYSLAGSLCNFVGPLLAGFAIDHVGHAAACLAIAILLLLGIAMLAAWGRVLPGPSPHAARKGSMLHTLADRRLWGVLLVSGLAQMANDIYQAFLPIYAHGLGLSASVIGSVMAALAIGSFGVRLVMLRLVAAMGEHRLLSIAFWWGAAAYLLVSLAHTAVMLAVATVAFGMAQGCCQPLTMMLMFSQSEEGRSGEAIGLRLTVNNLARILGPALFGIVGSAVGLLPVFWSNAVLMSLGGVLSRPRRK